MHNHHDGPRHGEDSNARNLGNNGINRFILEEAEDQRPVFHLEGGNSLSLDDFPFANADHILHSNDDSKPSIVFAFNILEELFPQLDFHVWPEELWVEEHLMIQILLLNLEFLGRNKI